MQLLLSVSLAIALGAGVLVGGLLWRLRDSAGHEMTMTAAMAIATCAGLMSGIIAGLLSPQDLWVPTVLGVGVGLGAGYLAGKPGGTMAVLQAVMAGFMGGTMGAMMGGMMPAQGAGLLTAGTALTLLLVGVSGRELLRSGNPDGHHGGHDHDMPGMPALTIPRGVLGAAAGALLVSGLVGWFGLGPLVHQLPLGGQHNHIQPIDMTVTATDFRFTPPALDIAVGQPVRLHFINKGQVEHDLTIPGVGYRLLSRQDQRSEPLGLHLYAKAGAESVLEFVPIRAGDFPLHCSVPGHQDLGMTGTLHVTGQP